MRQRAIWAGYGLLSTAVGLAVAHLVAALTNLAASPVLAVGSAVIDQTPTPMKEWAIRTFGDNDKTILVGSVMLGVAVLAAGAGLLAQRRLLAGVGLLVVLTAVAGLAVVTRPAAEVTDLLPTLTAAVTGAAALTWLARQQRSFHEASGGRRGVLIAIGVISVATVAAASLGRVVAKLRLRPEDVALPDPVKPAPPLARGLDQQVPGITSFRTDNGDFYRVDTRLDVPVLSADDWTLKIDGDVEREVTLDFDDLLDMPMIERDITLTCVSNSVGGPYVGGARWLGVRLTDVLKLAGVGSSADQILSTDYDGMTISTPLELATDGRDAMICVGMNGEPLPREHGFPVRMVIPGLYGFISATKWLTKLTLTTYSDQEAYWTERGWATDAPIKIAARIDTPNSLADLDSGDVVIGGVAWAQNDGGVEAVEIRVDDGPWRKANLGPDGGNVYWRQWFYKWPADSGSHRIAARTVAGNGEQQIEARAEPFPDGSSGIHSLLVNVA